MIVTVSLTVPHVTNIPSTTITLSRAPPLLILHIIYTFLLQLRGRHRDMEMELQFMLGGVWSGGQSLASLRYSQLVSLECPCQPPGEALSVSGRYRQRENTRVNHPK
jgi:hypothetical protein